MTGPTREPSERKPNGWRSKSKRKPGSLQREQSEAKKRPTGKPGKNSGRGRDERYDYTIGSTKRAALAFDIDLKETEQLTYRLSSVALAGGLLVSGAAGRNFGLQIKFLKEGKSSGDYMVIPTDVFDDMVAVISGKET